MISGKGFYNHQLFATMIDDSVVSDNSDLQRLQQVGIRLSPHGSRRDCLDRWNVLQKRAKSHESKLGGKSAVLSPLSQTTSMDECTAFTGSVCELKHQLREIKCVNCSYL